MRRRPPARHCGPRSALCGLTRAPPPARSQKCDLYVVRVLPAGMTDDRPPSPDSPRPATALPHFGNSRPCLRCLRALDALGVHRVVFTTGDAAAEAGRIGCEVRTVRELLRDEDGHVSRGDACENERKGLARGTRCAPCE